MHSRNSDTHLSKSLSWLLRHGAIKEGLNIRTDGFIDLDEILSHQTFRQKNCTEVDIKRLVKNDNKNRFTMVESNIEGKWKLKANQGHSISQVGELGLRKICEKSEVPSIVVHGTYSRYWHLIKGEGLRRMNRNHIHFAISDSVDQKQGEQQISGIRENCQILIYIDVLKAMESGIEFYISENNVVLSSGKNGFIKPEFFSKIVDRKTGKLLN